MSDLWARLGHDRRLPLLTPSSVDDAVLAVDAVAARGLGTLEVALRTPVAEAALAAALAEAADRDVLVGAGTVLTTAQVDRVAGLGAAFVVTPGWDARVVERCQSRGVAVLPGVATPGEAMAALAAGLDAVKLFPAAQLGGPGMARALAGPFPRLRLVPSGGVLPGDVEAYLAVPSVLAVSASWLVAA